jgi:RNA polymerase sigma-70 factor (ECF subfamily)
MLASRRRRALPMDLMDVQRADAPVPQTTAETMWVGPMPDGRVIAVAGGDPAAETEMKESIRLAFVAALQYLPPRQRAVLILREVLKWKASEVAELLDTTVVSVNSALQRARSTLAERNVTESNVSDSTDAEQQALLERYVDAFERFDIDSLVKLLHDDATMQMPPYPMWLRGADEYAAWMRGPGRECAGSRLAPISVNGVPGFAQWRVDPSGGYSAWAIHVLQISGGRITGFDFFVDPNLFALFDLPVHLPVDQTA